ncbi:MAG: uracil-DNA glycosylase [Candidatus Omnitrophica bacterium]|nr:uracil-DNA glycosylase [Candidatus Omnitrophota bacterium]MDD5430291.1 uracil-DNA glycosylase [Candidatus Omnitrophota bacterium]
MTAEEIQKLNQEIHSCQKCPLGATRTNAVPGQGNLNAKVMFIGEAPGATEDAQGIPFCGKAGGVLDELLAIAGLKREEIFIGNILKCRPPNNRNPQEIEIKTCTPYLDRQIELIKPSVLCCLGNFSTGYIMKKFSLGAKVQGITKIHGKIFLSDVAYGKIKIMPLFHPAVVTYDMSKKSVLAEDFRLLKNIPK